MKIFKQTLLSSNVSVGLHTAIEAARWIQKSTKYNILPFNAKQKLHTVTTAEYITNPQARSMISLYLLITGNNQICLNKLWKMLTVDEQNGGETIFWSNSGANSRKREPNIQRAQGQYSHSEGHIRGPILYSRPDNKTCNHIYDTQIYPMCFDVSTVGIKIKLLWIFFQSSI